MMRLFIWRCKSDAACCREKASGNSSRGVLLKWERYSKMSPAHREEWNFKWGEMARKPSVPSGLMYSVLCVWGLMVVALLTMVFVFYTPLGGDFAPLRSQLIDSSFYSLQWGGVAAVLLVATTVLNIGINISQSQKESRWLKERGY